MLLQSCSQLPQGSGPHAPRLRAAPEGAAPALTLAAAQLQLCGMTGSRQGEPLSLSVYGNRLCKHRETFAECLTIRQHDTWHESRPSASLSAGRCIQTRMRTWIWRKQHAGQANRQSGCASAESAATSMSRQPRFSAVQKGEACPICSSLGTLPCVCSSLAAGCRDLAQEWHATKNGYTCI